jgi:hypothetical protein
MMSDGLEKLRNRLIAIVIDDRHRDGWNMAVARDHLSCQLDMLKSRVMIHSRFVLPLIAEGLLALDALAAERAAHVATRSALEAVHAEMIEHQGEEGWDSSHDCWQDCLEQIGAALAGSTSG